MDDLRIDVVAPDSPEAGRVLHAYVRDVAGSFLGRPATGTEVDDALRADPNDDLDLFLLARTGDSTVGCAGLQLLDQGIGEVKRVFVEPQARGRGVGRRLMAELERRARALGVTRLRLDTRHDLVPARALYASVGYREVPAFNDGRYAEHWLAKPLR